HSPLLAGWFSSPSSRCSSWPQRLLDATCRISIFGVVSRGENSAYSMTSPALPLAGFTVSTTLLPDHLGVVLSPSLLKYCVKGRCGNVLYNDSPRKPVSRDRYPLGCRVRGHSQ